jgi:protein-tyrosine phosphatase
LEGAVNFRDLGGYSTTDGHRVRWGMVYRSNHLVGLTSRDYEYLGPLGIHLVCDLRTDWERQRSPTNWKGKAPEFLIAPIGDDAQVKAAMEQIKNSFDAEGRTASAGPREAGPAAAQNPFGYYQTVVTNSDQYAQILRRIAHGDLPTLTHCTGGEDRTGIFSAVLLATLGVPRKTIMQDYLLTRENFLDETNIQRTTADVQRMLGLDRTPDAAFIRKTFAGLDGSLMEGMFDMIDKNSGSFDTFVRQVLKVSDGDVALLRQNLLEK